jgi:acyl-CoA thioester hydrolase
MPRTKLTEQEKYEFRFSLQVRPQDVNYGGHLGNDSLISLIGTARAYLFRDLGFSELDLGDGHTGIIIADLTVNYRSEAFLFDELVIETHVGEIELKRFRMFHRITKQSTLVALAEVGFGAYSYEQRKVVSIPDPFLNALAMHPSSAGGAGEACR